MKASAESHADSLVVCCEAASEAQTLPPTRTRGILQTHCYFKYYYELTICRKTAACRAFFFDAAFH